MTLGTALITASSLAYFDFKELPPFAIEKPLAQKEKERSRFSRARMPPQERRVRVTQAAATLDASGRAYLAFAVDVRYRSEWRQNDLVGCAYLQTGALFVKQGDDYRAAEILLGKDADVAPGVCAPGKARS